MKIRFENHLSMVIRNEMKSLCIFIHYSKFHTIPLYVKLFVSELENYFDEIVIVYNERQLNDNNQFRSSKVTTFASKNDGYDFGHFYRYYSQIDTSCYYQIACINDSNILINRLDHVFKWANDSSLDFWGLLDSHEKPWFSCPCRSINSHE